MAGVVSGGVPMLQHQGPRAFLRHLGQLTPRPQPSAASTYSPLVEEPRERTAPKRPRSARRRSPPLGPNRGGPGAHGSGLARLARRALRLRFYAPRAALARSGHVPPADEDEQ